MPGLDLKGEVMNNRLPKLLVLGSLLLCITQANSASFQGIGLGTVEVMSGDGSTVGGGASIWTSGSGARLVTNEVGSHMAGLSYDGKLAIGTSIARGQTFISSQAGPAEYIANPANVTDGFASGISSDGKTALADFRNQPTFDGGTGTYFLSTQTKSWTKIDPLPFASATALSPDGKTVLGHLYSSNGTLEGVKWTQDTGLQQLPTPTDDENGNVINGNGGVIRVTPTDVSTNGDVVVGSIDAGLSFHRAFRWTVDGGMTLLSPIPGVGGNFASAMTPDGRFIVGGEGYARFGGDGNAAFIWDRVTAQSERVSDVLAGLGVDLGGWRLSGASAISDDGAFIAGTGLDPQGNTRAWIANLAPVPEVSQWAMLLAGLAILGACHARNAKSST
jgi:hypothetical protein